MEVAKIKESNLNLYGRAWCYFVPALPNKGDRYFVGIVIADEAGYHLTDWDYGKDGTFAAEVVAKMNLNKLGLDDEATARIVLASMSLS